MRGLKKLGLVFALLTFGASSAMAATTAAMVTNFLAQSGGWSDVLSVIAYIAGIGFGIKAALKLKEHNESKGQVPISQPITMFIVAGLLIALPTFLTTAADSVNGVGNRKTNATTGSLRTVP